ncbi:MAG: hypothetical protein KAG72_06525 [Abyssibacter sp.]|nr:hypothetical protein [Abyssibacter sp.]MCK5858982.1 hypothetical protein [Abyssibacter sp.]
MKDSDATAGVVASYLPLVVDLDHSLIRTDVFDETLIDGLRRQPLQTLACLNALRRGRAALKSALADATTLDVGRLPLNRDVLGLIDDARRMQRPVFLVSSADQRLVDGIADRLGGLAGWQGSSESLNLKGARKAQWLVQRFGDGGFEYVGDSHSDLQVWRHAGALTTVGLGPWMRRAANVLGRNQSVLVLHLSAPAGGRARLRPWARLLRPRQWLAAEGALFLTLCICLQAVDAVVAALPLIVGYWLLGNSGRMGGGVFGAQVHRGRPAAASIGDTNTSTNPYADGRLRLRTGALLFPFVAVVGLVFVSRAGDWVLGSLAVLHAGLCAVSTYAGPSHPRHRWLLAAARLATSILTGVLLAVQFRA